MSLKIHSLHFQPELFLKKCGAMSNGHEEWFHRDQWIPNMLADYC